MKKALALLVVLAVLAIPVMALAHSTDITPTDFVFSAPVTSMNDEFYMFPEADVDATDEAAVELPPTVGIPAAGPVVLAGVAMVLATMGCALIPKK